MYKKTPTGRVSGYCSEHNVNLVRYVLDGKYRHNTKLMLSGQIRDGENGLVDSVRALLLNYDATKRLMMQNLLKSY